MADMEQKNSPFALKELQNAVHKQNKKQAISHCMLPQNEQIYISSIISATFEQDFILINGNQQLRQRKIIRNDLVQCYLKLNAHQHIFFTALFYLQKFLSNSQPQQYQNKCLVFTCMALARKYQKGKLPNILQWCERLNVQFKKQEIQNLQNEIIQALNFQLEPITRYNFMSDLFLTVNLDQKVKNFCYYLIDLSVCIGFKKQCENQQFFSFSQAQIGISVVRLGCYFFVPDQLQSLPVLKLGFNLQRIHQCCQVLFQLFMNKKLHQTRPIRHKYKKSKYMQVARIQFFKLEPEKQKQTADQDEKDSDKNILQKPLKIQCQKKQINLIQV